MTQQTKPLARLWRVGRSLIILSFAGASVWAAENRGTKSGELSDDNLRGPELVEPDADRMDRFVIFNQKLKTAVCDEGSISKAPSLDAINPPEDQPAKALRVALGKGLGEPELISFLLGDSLAGVYSDFVREQIKLVLEQRSLGKSGSGLSGDQFVEAQAAVAGIKRRVSLDVCGAVVEVVRLKQLLNARPSRFLEGTIGDKHPRPSGVVVAEVIDSSGRFARVGDRLAAAGGARASSYLMPGWLESYEIDRVTIHDAKGQPLRAYRRLFNPLTNDTQGIELVTSDDVPIGVLYVSHEPTATDWSTYLNTAELPATRTRQVENYRMRIESDAMQFLARHAELGDQARDIQEFYKQLLKAYQLFPNEKQFDAYAKAARSRRVPALDEVARRELGPAFLTSLRQARVNGGYAHVALFKPDAKLHAIYLEYHARLMKLADRAK